MQNNLKRSKHLGKYVSSAVLLIVCLLLLFPLIWGVISSFRDANDLRFYPGSFLPTNVKAWTIQNYIAIFSSEEYPVFNWIINSFIVALATTFIYLAIASLAAYAFVFMDLKYANILFGFLIATMTVPGIVNTVPQFTNIIQMGLNKNLLGLILPGLCGVYGLYLIRQFFLGIPKDLIENANKWYGNGHAISITRHANSMKKVAAALTFIKYYTQGINEKNQYNLTNWCSSGHIPAWKNVYQSDDYKTMVENNVTCKALGNPEDIIAMEGVAYESTIFNALATAIGNVQTEYKKPTGCTVDKAKEIINDTVLSAQAMLDMM